jgi:hypothetical protein
VIQLREAGRPDVGLRLHFCAIDDGEKIVTPQTVKMYGLVQAKSPSMPRPPAIEVSDFSAPVHEEDLLQRR